VLPTGRLHTFEFHEGRAEQAREEFGDNNFGDAVTVECRDVCSDGFGAQLRGKADAVFLDLPKPWLAIPHAIDALKIDGRVCSFSPCVEQVQMTATAMRAHGFRDLVTYECLRREVRVERVEWSTPVCVSRHLAAMAAADAGADAGAGAGAAASSEVAAVVAAAVETTAAAAAAAAEEASVGDEAAEPAAKRARQEGVASATAQRGGKRGGRFVDVAVTAVTSTGVRPFSTVRGHTSYLTFGRLYPTHAPPAAANEGAAAGGGAAMAPSS
jgi:hypothetical protein